MIEIASFFDMLLLFNHLPRGGLLGNLSRLP
jgi:hypothetical protein